MSKYQQAQNRPMLRRIKILDAFALAFDLFPCLFHEAGLEKMWTSRNTLGDIRYNVSQFVNLRCKEL